MSEAWNKERNEFFLRDLNCMNNSSLAFLADKVGMWECFFFLRSHCQRKSQRDIYFSHLHSFRVMATFVISAGDKSRQPLRLLLLSYEETHGMLGRLHVLLLLMYRCSKCPTLILLGLVSYPTFFVLSRNASPQSKTAAQKKTMLGAAVIEGCCVATKKRLFPSLKNPHFQNEAKCKFLPVIMSSIYMGIKNHFQLNGLVLSLALKQRLWATR